MNSRSYFKVHISRLHLKIALLFLVSFVILNSVIQAGELFLPADILKTKACNEIAISPNGEWIAYTVTVHRCPEDKPGEAYRKLYLVSTKTAEIRPFITGKVNIKSPQWSPDGSKIAFRAEMHDDEKTQVWFIAQNGGEAIRLTNSESDVLDYRWRPSGTQLAYIATTPKTTREKTLQKKGYDFVFFEENLKHRNLYLLDVNDNGKGKSEQLTDDVTVWSFEFNAAGNKIAAAISQQNLIDQKYMFQKIHLLDLKTKQREQLTDNPGKLGNFAFSPDGKKLVYSAALERKDHAISQAYVMDIKSRIAHNLTPLDFRGHITWVGWKDNSAIIYRADEGVWPTLSTIKASGGERTIILNSKLTGIVFDKQSCASDAKHVAIIGEAPDIPGDVFYWKPGNSIKRLTTLNPWIADKTLGKQQLVRYQARDGLEIEGILLYPVGYQASERYPLIVIVHGGPESNYSNEWMTSYSEPGQVLAGKGYAVFYPNYRASTGYGVKFAAAGYEDAAGKEFDDIADGIDFLIAQGIADPQRVGLGGGSYGGYAAAWFSSYYTKYVNAVCMFVGISDLISKRSTTDIPYEELYVHSGKLLEEIWDFELKRSPIYWAHQSKTAVLILGGTDDPRVHPSQSLEYFRQLKMNDHPAVRFVQYPGEKHGNAEQPGRIDVLYRMLDWYDWYVKDRQPLDGPLPPLDISDKYGLDLDE